MNHPFEETDLSLPSPDPHHCQQCGTTNDAALALSQQVANLQQQVEHLLQLVITDNLTGLYNHRHFTQSLEQEMERTRRTGQPTALVLMDLDHFKQVNDEWGHEAGNRALQHTAQLIQNSTRKLDICCRYGGEEFVVILPSTDLLIGKQVAERLRKLVESSPLTYESTSIPLSISIGIDTYQAGQTEDHAAFTRRVDELLYKAKQAGRNQVLCGVGPRPASTTVSGEEKHALLSSFQTSDSP